MQNKTIIARDSAIPKSTVRVPLPKGVRAPAPSPAKVKAH